MNTNVPFTIDRERFEATTEEDIARQMIEDGETEDDFDPSNAFVERGPLKVVSMLPTRIAQLEEIESILRLDYELRGLPQYERALIAIREILKEAAGA